MPRWKVRPAGRNCSEFQPLEPRTLMAAVNVAINANATYQTIDGFGAAMITSRQPAEYLDAAFYDRIVNDLGASAARVPIEQGFEPVNDNADASQTNLGGFNPEAIRGEMQFLQKLKERGMTTFLGSVWTPPGWMKTNQSATIGGFLRPDMRDEYAEYLATAAKVAQSNFGIHLSKISLQNEPYFIEPYVSAIYDPQQFLQTLKSVQHRFTADGLTTGLMLPEDMMIADRMSWYLEPTLNDPEASQFDLTAATHDLRDLSNYQTVSNLLAPHDVPMWMTETSGEPATWDGAMQVAGKINKAMLGNSSAWFYWQWSDVAGSSNHALMIDGQPTPKYYAAKQYYRYVRPGAQRVDAMSSDANLQVTSYRQPSDGSMSIVLINQGTEADTVSFNASSGGLLPGTYNVVRSSATENAVSLGTITGGSNFSLNIPANSIVTLYSGADITPKSGSAGQAMPFVSTTDPSHATPMHTAALEGGLSSLKSQIAAGGNVNVKAANGWTPLHAAASGPNANMLSIVQTLLDAGANVNAVTNDGLTPLHTAVSNSFATWGTPDTLVVDRVNMLIAAGANVNAKDAAGRTPLMWAAMMGKTRTQWNELETEDPSIAQALIDAGADVNLRDNAGKSAEDYARQMGYPVIADTIKSNAPGIVKPIAIINGPDSVSEGGSISLTGENSFKGNGGLITTYEWDLNYDGVTFTPDATTTALVFYSTSIDGPSTRTVALRVTDTSLRTSVIATSTLHILNVAPTATLTGSTVTQGNTGTVTFSGQTDAALADRNAGFKYSYDFNNDGTFELIDVTSATATVPASYLTTLGTRTVAGRIKDKDGGVSVYTTTVQVNAAPVNVGSISGLVFADANRSGGRDGAEGIIAGQFVYLDANNSGGYDAGEANTTTDANGGYSFANLPVNTYRVRATPATGFYASFPSGGVQLVQLAAGQNASGLNLGIAPNLPPPPPPPPPPATLSTVRINAGGSALTDSKGVAWSADSGFTGGSISNGPYDVLGTTDDSLYAPRRIGTNFSFSKAVTNGSYQLRLLFAEPWWNGSGQRKFDVFAEGKLILDDYDIVQDVGAKRAVDKTYAVAVTDGTLNLSFISSLDNAIISGIELTPATTPIPTQQPVRINAGGSAFTASGGNVWSADSGFSASTVSTGAYDVLNTTDDVLYYSRRYAQNFTFAKTVANGNYQLKLLFAEPYWGSVGQRKFDVFAEGNLILDDYDIIKDAGGTKKAISKTFNVSVTDGALNLSFIASLDNAIISGIEIVPV